MSTGPCVGRTTGGGGARMDLVSLMQLVAARSTSAQRGALNALRAIAVDSPVVQTRVARVAHDALLDAAADWTAEERAHLVEAVAMGGTMDSDPHRDRLSQIIAESGLSDTEFARKACGVDSGTVARWLSLRQAIPGTRAEWIDDVVRIVVTDDEIGVFTKRG